jgi:hypothetical protein
MAQVEVIIPFREPAQGRREVCAAPIRHCRPGHVLNVIDHLRDVPPAQFVDVDGADTRAHQTLPMGQYYDKLRLREIGS